MPTECPICDEEYSSPGGTRDHAWDAHGACHYCGDRFDDEDGLYAHWLAAHDGDLTRVDRKRAEDAVGDLSFGDRLEHRGPIAALAETPATRRAILAGGGLALAAGVGGALATDLLGGGGDAAADVPEGTVAAAPIPDAPDDHRYATMGSDGAAVTVTYFGSWKCPYCARFSTGFLGTLVEEYVEPGDVAVEFRDLAYVGGDPFLGPDAPAAGHAGLAVWNADPASYWAFHEHVMANQPPESERWATADGLASFAEAAGVDDPGAVRAAVRNREYEAALRDSSAAAAEAGVSGTPKLLIDGTAVNPLAKPETTKRRIEDAIGGT